MSDVVVPALGESVSEATIAKWYKKAGDAVKADELLLELETEKVTLEVNAPEDGVLENISANEGDSVEVGQVVGKIKAGGAPSQKAEKESSESTDKQPAPASKEQDKAADDAAKAPAEQPQSKSNIDKAETMPPSVRKMVTENQLDVNKIEGTGKDGRVNKGDVIAHMENAGGQAQQQEPKQTEQKAATAQPANGDKKVEVVKMSRLRKTIAQRLKDSQNTAAILTTFNEIDMSNVMALRSKYKESFKEKHGVKLGFMSFFTKAVVNALQSVPSVNAEIRGDEIIYKHHYDIGVAVGTEQGLVVPVVRGADQLSFAGIEKNIVALAKSAREGKLSMSDLSGGTFTITNGGVYGSLLSTPIINPPQTGIIGLHNTQQRPVAVDGKVEIRPMMYIALSYDHRIIDGKDAVTFLIKVKEAIEDPQRLLLDM